MNIIDKLKAEEVPNNVHQAIEWENGFKCGLDRSIEIVEAHNPWISVEDELPPIIDKGLSDEVLIKFIGDTSNYVGYIQENGRWYVDYVGYSTEVNCWMPIPKTTKP